MLPVGVAPESPLARRTLSGRAWGIFARADALNGVVRPVPVLLYLLPLVDEERMLDAGERGLERVVGGLLATDDAPAGIADTLRPAAEVDAAPVDGFE